MDNRPLKKPKTCNADFVNDGLPTPEIRSIIVSMREFVQSNCEKAEEHIETSLQELYPFFAKRYPMLFAMACKKDNFDNNSLEYFLNMRDNIINQKLTSEEASKKVGQDWFDKYVNVSDLAKKENKSI